MSSAKTAVFRADASPEIGGGHIVRCLALAEALAGRGWRCGFAVGAGTPETVPALARAGYDLEILDPDQAGEPAALARRWPDAADWLIVDHYGRDAAFEKACLPWAEKILVIDDLADRDHHCDLLLDQNLGRRPTDYAARVPSDCRLLLGPHYALLRPEFAARRAAALAHRRGGGVRRILVSLGASDPHNATAVVLEGIARSGLEAEVEVVLGAAAPGLAEVRNLIPRMPQITRLHIDARNMAELMAEADLAIGAGGTTCWERCCMGLPSLIVVTGPDQGHNAATLEQAGAAIGLGGHETLTADAVARALGDWMAKETAADEFSRRSALICDGLGGARLCMLLDGPLAKDGRGIRLRPATKADADDLLAWQSEPEARRHFRDPRVPERTDHLAWLERRLADPRGSLDVILHDEQPSGSLRLDPVEGPGGQEVAYEVSILVPAAKRQLGLAKAALSMARQMMPWAEFRAEVAAENEASRRLFTGAGYTERGGILVSPAPAGPKKTAGDEEVRRRA